MRDAVPPHYLWLTWIDPSPEHDGQRLYSGKLIEAVAEAGAKIEVLCFASEESAHRAQDRDGNVTWWTVSRGRRPAWASVFSSLPNVAYRSATAEMAASLHHGLANGHWDKIVFDGLATGWALPILEPVRTAGAGYPEIIYVAHNHEESTRALVARNYEGGNPFMRLALAQDAQKARRLERRLVDAADVVTAISEEDAEKFRSNAPDKRIIVLPPGYAGARVRHREITDDTPRLAVLVGSFDWVAKQMNLEEFLAHADAALAAEGIRLRIIGGGPPGYVENLARHAMATEFLGRVTRVEPHLHDARIAVVPERTGGGFKLKILDYVFNRIPILAMEGSIAGAPLRPPADVLTYRSFDDLVSGIIHAVDDLPLLNSLQNRAFDACVDGFDWRQRGERFLAYAEAK